MVSNVATGRVDVNREGGYWVLGVGWTQRRIEKMKWAIDEDGERRFAVRCDAGSRALLSLSMLALSLAMLMGIWWPGHAVELVAPWLGEDWGHSKAWMYVVFLGLVGASAALLGMYFGEWKRGHRILFDGEEGMVHTEEWWEGKDIETSFPLECFATVEIHEEDEGEWMLGVVLDNGSYWQLLDGSTRQELEPTSDRLQSLIDGGKGEGEATPEVPEPFHVEREEHAFAAGWRNRGHWASKLGFAVSAGLLAIASVVPAVATFDGEVAWLVAVLLLGAAVFVLPTVVNMKLRGLSVTIGAWMGIVAAGVCGLGANWLYAPLATVGLGWLGAMMVHGIIDIWKPNALWLEIDHWGAVYHNEGAVTDEEGVVRVSGLEGTVANVHRLEPATMWLVPPEGKEENVQRCLRRLEPGEEHEMDAVRLRLGGVSLFERVALSLIVDDEIRRRRESEAKLKIRPQL